VAEIGYLELTTGDETMPMPLYILKRLESRRPVHLTPYPGISIGRKKQVSTPKRYKVCHNSDKTCQLENGNTGFCATRTPAEPLKKPL
jgi:hypothetical protein